MGEKLDTNKKGGKGEWKIPTDDSEVYKGSTWVDDNGRKSLEVPLSFETYKREVDYDGRSKVVSGEVADNIVDFFKAKKKIGHVAYNARKAA